MVSSLDCPSAKSAKRSMIGWICVSSDNSAMDYVFVVEVKVFRREESVGVNSADSLPIEVNVGAGMAKSGWPFLNTRGWLALVERCISSVERKLLSDGEATSFRFDVIGAPFGGQFTLVGRGARGIAPPKDYSQRHCQFGAAKDRAAQLMPEDGPTWLELLRLPGVMSAVLMLKAICESQMCALPSAHVCCAWRSYRPAAEAAEARGRGGRRRLRRPGDASATAARRRMDRRHTRECGRGRKCGGLGWHAAGGGGCGGPVTMVRSWQ
eukprot:scaffold2773_cov123-Isochrysis_galbana.AAC.1